jgi:hypothetical protein
MLKFKLPDLVGIPHEVAEHYAPAEDGSFVLRVEGMVANVAVNSFETPRCRFMPPRGSARAAPL